MLNIIRHKYIPFIFSGTMMLISLIGLLTFGLKPGIDFTGGSLMEVSFSGARPSVSEVQEVLKASDITTSLVQPINQDSMQIKMRFISEEEHQKVLTALRASFAKDEDKVYEKRIETIGPAVSATLRNRAWWAGVLVNIGIVLYIAYAFRKVSHPIQSWKFGLVAIVTLIHDVGITAGMFSFIGHFREFEMDIPFVVALLTVLGYSVNDTIVVFDRIREKLIRRGGSNFAETVNMGINETIIRSLFTSMTVILVLVALFFFGGETIHYFSLALIIGMVFGTYSSIFLASPLLVVWEEFSRKRRA